MRRCLVALAGVGIGRAGRPTEDALRPVAVPRPAVDVAQGPPPLRVGDHHERRPPGGCRRWAPAGPGAGTPRSAPARPAGSGRGAAARSAWWTAARRASARARAGSCQAPVGDHPPVARRAACRGAPLPPTSALPATDVPAARLSAGAASARAGRSSSPTRGSAGPTSRCPSRRLGRDPRRARLHAESCGFRDHAASSRALGAEVLGLSAQPTELQREAVERLRLPFPSSADEELRLARRRSGCRPSAAAGRTLLRRLTLAADGTGVVERVWYPVVPPDRHAERRPGATSASRRRCRGACAASAAGRRGAGR